VFGGNGAGKSLLASLIKGDLRESNKYVTYREGFSAGTDIFTVSFEEQQRLWQRDDRFDISEFNENASDKGTVVSTLIGSGRSDANANQTLLNQLLDSLDLRGVYHKGIRFLSSGQIRKVLLARALYADNAGKPKLLILDDPLESIDRSSRQRIAHVIQLWMNEGNSSVLLCRRQQDLFPALTHMAVMQDLRIEKQGVVEEIILSDQFLSIAARPVPKLRELPAAPAEYQLPEPDPGSKLIELKEVSAGYQGQPVLVDVTWTMACYHHVLVEGPNGCGKSTLLSLIDGENHKAYGQPVFLFGRRRGTGETVWDIKSRFGIVSNELHNKYVKGWRVLDVIVSGFFNSVGLYDDSGASEIDTAKRWLGVLGLEKLAKRYYHEISYGQQRLVLLARAMVKHPTVLVLDEPCVGLDDYHRALILHTLSCIAEQTSTRLIYVSHVEGEAPDCINQRLRFIPLPAGGHRIDVK